MYMNITTQPRNNGGSIIRWLPKLYAPISRTKSVFIAVQLVVVEVVVIVYIHIYKRPPSVCWYESSKYRQRPCSNTNTIAHADGPPIFTTHFVFLNVWNCAAHPSPRFSVHGNAHTATCLESKHIYNVLLVLS